MCVKHSIYPEKYYLVYISKIVKNHAILVVNIKYCMYTVRILSSLNEIKI